MPGLPDGCLGQVVVQVAQDLVVVVAHVGGEGDGGRGEGVRAGGEHLCRVALLHVLAAPLKVVLQTPIARKLHQDAQWLCVLGRWGGGEEGGMGRGGRYGAKKGGGGVWYSVRRKGDGVVQWNRNNVLVFLMGVKLKEVGHEMKVEVESVEMGRRKYKVKGGILITATWLQVVVGHLLVPAYLFGCTGPRG